MLAPDNQAIYLVAGGTISNVATGIISAGWNGINVSGPGTVFNAGSVDGGGQGILFRGGYISNASGATLYGGSVGIQDLDVAATIVNAGSIAGATVFGVELDQGGRLTNRSTGTIVGGTYGILANHAAATIVNAGYIKGTSADAVLFATGQTNRLVIAPGASFSGIVDGGNTAGATAVSTLELASAASAGTLTGIGAQFIHFAQTTIDAGAHWTLSGANTLASGYTMTNAGVLIESGTLTNDGSIDGSGTIVLTAGATIVGGGAIAGTETIIQAYGTAIAGAASVTNAVATTLLGGSGGVSIGGLGTIDNSGTLTGLYNVGATLNAGGFVTNAASGTISGLNYGVRITGDTGTVINAGSIGAGYGLAVMLLADGYVSNASGGTIDGPAAGVLTSGPGQATVVNAGFIRATGTFAPSVNVLQGTIVNQATGTITGSYSGIRGHNAVTVVNDGLIQGTGIVGGIKFDGVGSVANNSSGTIAGSSFGVLAVADSTTVVNAGTISGATDAVKFASGVTNRLVIDPGAVFTGTVDGGNTIGATATSTLELASGASAGTLTSLGSQFIRFGQITVDANAAWTFNATDTVGSGVTLTNAGTLTGPVTLASGAILTNAATGTIAGNPTGVYASGAVNIGNAGSIAGTALYGVFLSAGGYVSNASSGRIVAPNAGIFVSNAAGTVVNDGSVGGGSAVWLSSGGTVSNRSSGIIGGTNNGIFVQTTTGRVVNAGQIVGTAQNGVILQAGGSVTNQSGGSISGYDFNGVGILNAAGTVVNAGSVVSTNASGIYLAASGSIANQAGGTISGGTDGVSILGAGTVVNAGAIAGATDAVRFAAGATNRLIVAPGASFTGTVEGGNTLGATATSTLELASAGTAGTLTSLGSQFVHFANVTIDAGAQWTLTSDTIGSGYTIADSGTLTNTGSLGSQVRLTAGAALTNRSAGTIAASANAVYALGTATVVNAGSIDGGTAAGIKLNNGGIVGNLSGGRIAGFSVGIYGANGAAATVTNAGYIYSYRQGIYLAGTGTITNQSGGTIATSTTVTPGRGADGILAMGITTVVNAGRIVTARYGVVLVGGGYISNLLGGTLGGGAGVVAYDANTTVVNAGNIGGLTGVMLYGGGSATNLSSGSISSTGLAIRADSIANVVNVGFIYGAGQAIHLRAGGTVVNQAGGILTTSTTITPGGGGDAIYGRSGTPVTVVNAGTIEAARYVIALVGGGIVTNQSGGTIDAGTRGISINGGTVTNAGTISGSNLAVYNYGGSNFRLIVDPRAVFTGTVDGGNTVGATATSTLELASGASAGTLTSLGSQFVHFANFTIDAGAQWTLASDTIGSSYTITDSGTLTNTGTLGSAVTLGNDAVLTNNSGGKIVSGAAATVYGVYPGVGTVTNAGSIGNTVGVGVQLAGGGRVTNASGGTISAVSAGIAAGGTVDSTVVNAGVILTTDTFAPAVDLYEGGTLTNLSGGTVSGSYSAVRASTHAFLKVVNAGLLQGTGGFWGIGSGDGASITNQSSGTIQSSNFGIAIDGITHNGPSTVVNSGLVQGGTTHGSAINFARGGFVTNLSGGTITGYSGITGGAGVTGWTISNAGTIAGTQAAIQIAGGLANRVIFNPGAVFTGTVDGGNTIGATATSTLELASGASTGTLSSFGTQFVDFAQTTIDVGASWLLTGANVFDLGTTIVNAGTLTVFDTTVDDGGVLVNNGKLIVDPATLTVAVLTGTGNVVIDANSTLAVTGTVTAGETITFAGNSGELIIDPTKFAGTIHAFQLGTTIDLTGVIDLTTASIVNGNTLEILRSGNPAIDLTLDTGYNFAGVTFTASPTGILTTDNNPCFCPGTLIRTDKGEVAVEDLRVGDRVVTASGTLRPISWIGYRHMDLTRHPSPHQVQPIRVRAGAFAPNEPTRDLFLSPEHAVLCDGLLIPIRLLVNGTSIQRETRRAVTYFHIELETHDILLAENLRVESYLDTGNRGMFENADAPLLLHPDLTNDQARRACESAAPFADDPALVQPVWQALANRSEAMGLAMPRTAGTTHNSELRVEVEGRLFRPVAIDGDRYVFMLPAWNGPLKLLSRHAIANEDQPWLVDQRQLGVMVREITLSVGDDCWPIAVDNPALGEGWWDAERDSASMWRWTNGNATVGVTSDKRCRLDIRLGDRLSYPTAAAFEAEIGSLAA